jgi:hypothetical protein
MSRHATRLLVSRKASLRIGNSHIDRWKVRHVHLAMGLLSLPQIWKREVL